MAQRKINWTQKANAERMEILDYWIKRNKSVTYSTKLNRLFTEAVKKIAGSPTIGRKTDFSESTRVKVVRDYLIFYEYDDLQLKFYLFGMETAIRTRLK